MDRSVGSPRTRSVVGVRGPGVSVFGLPEPVMQRNDKTNRSKNQDKHIEDTFPAGQALFKRLSR